MRKLLLLAVASSTLAVVGTAAAVKPGAVSISASRSIVVYGGTVKLSGVVSSHQANAKVHVLSRAYGASTFSEIASVDTTTGGAWSYTASPAILTRYQAQVGSATSRNVTVKVRPKIVLELKSRTARRGTFMVTVNGARSFTGKYVLVQRLTSSGPVTLKHVKLGADSSATFTIRLPTRRTRVRVVMSSSQAAPGYIAGYSNVWKSSS
jgi:hypothetical protein